MFSPASERFFCFKVVRMCCIVPLIYRKDSQSTRERASVARHELRFRDFPGFSDFPGYRYCPKYSYCPDPQIHRKFIDFSAKLNRRGCIEKSLRVKNSKIPCNSLSNMSYYVCKHKNKFDPGIWCGYYRCRPRRHFWPTHDP